MDWSDKMSRDDAYIHHNDFDEPKNGKRLSDNIYEKTKSKMKSQEKEKKEEPME